MMKILKRNCEKAFFLLLIFVVVSCSSKNQVPTSYKPIFKPASSVRILRFANEKERKDKFFILLEDLWFDFGEGKDRISLRVPAGFVCDTTSFAGLRGQEAFNNSGILHDYLYWVQPCTNDCGRKIANKIIKQTVKQNFPDRVIAWCTKKGIQLLRFFKGEDNDPWAKNARLKATGETRFATEFIEGYREEISNTSWDKFREEKSLTQIELDREVNDIRVCGVFKNKWPECAVAK